MILFPKSKDEGYRELTKGSRVIAYRTVNGVEVGQEYCRIFTKDTPYFTYDDLQKSEGITTYGRKFADSVLDQMVLLFLLLQKREKC